MASIAELMAKRRAEIQGGNGGVFAGREALGRGAPQNPWTDINPTWNQFDYRDPLGAQKLFEQAYPGAQQLGQVDPAILEAMRARSVAESGARQRGVLNR